MTGGQYQLPNPLTGYPLLCMSMKVPDVQEYRVAARTTLLRLANWHTWERTGDTSGAIAASLWLDLIHNTLSFDDCDEKELFGGDMAQFGMCYHFDSLGNKIYRFTLNGGCTWTDIGLCEGSNIPTEPIIPIVEPIDQPGTTPDPYLTPEARCRIINQSYFMVFYRAHIFFNTVINGTPANRASNCISWLGSLTTSTNGMQWYPKFKLLIEKYVPHIATIVPNVDDAWWSDAFDCIMMDCVPSDPRVTRDVMNCFSDAVDALRPNVGTDPSLYYYFSYMADFWRAYPLSVIREDAFRDALNPAIDATCPIDCDTTPADCEDLIITFDAGGAAYTLTAGVANLEGRDGFGLAGVQVPDCNEYIPSTMGETGYAAQMSIPFGEVCSCKSIFFHENNRTIPDLNANNMGYGNVYRFQFYNNGALVSDQTYWDIGLYYYYDIASWRLRFGREFETAIVADEVVITWAHGGSNGYQIDFRIDDIVVHFE